MKFELGKCYKHPSGDAISIIGKVDTYIYGECFVAECTNMANLKAVGMDETSAENWVAINYTKFLDIMVGNTKAPQTIEPTTYDDRVQRKKGFRVVGNKKLDCLITEPKR